MQFVQVWESSDCRSDTSLTSDVGTDDPSAGYREMHSRSHTISDTELDVVVAKQKKKKVYRKKRGQTRRTPTVQNIHTKGYLSPVVTGANINDLLKQCKDSTGEGTEVDVIVTTSPAAPKMKVEDSEKFDGKCSVII